MKVGTPAAVAAILLALAGAAPAAAAAAADSETSKRLEVTVRSWSLEGRPLELRVETRGALAVRPVGLLVFVDGRHVAEGRTENGVARIEIPAEALAAGRRHILVKSGSERTRFEVRILPRAGLWAGAAVLLAATVGMARLARRRRG